MQGTKIRLLTGGLLMMAAASYVQADALQPDPAWQQGTLANGFQWQVLATPQRPSDRIEIRLSVNTGSLTESTQQSGFSHFIPRLALTQSGSLQAVQVRSLWQQGIDPKRPLPPAVVSYDYTMFNLSLPNNRSDLLKEALTWLSDTAGKVSITPETVNYALSNSDMVATWPADTKEGWWRYRLKGSTLLGHDPAEPLKQPVDIEQVKSFYQNFWLTLALLRHAHEQYGEVCHIR
jgi:predicted Zn-dependent peptidase